MKRQWNAEIQITENMAKLLIEEQFPHLSPAAITHMSDGWDNRAFLVNKKYVFRFPRRKVAVELIENEIKILPEIALSLPIPVPVPVFKGKPSDLFPWPFSGYAFIPGVTACRMGLTQEDRIKMAPVLAKFLKTLHGIPTDRALSLGAEPDKIGRLDLKKRIPRLKDYLKELNEKRLIKEPGRILQVIEETNVEPIRKKISLVHGDFYARHILVDEKAEISGIIDWGDIHTGNPAIDISIAPAFLPHEGQKIFRKSYGKIDEETWRLSRFKALSMALILLAFGHDTEDFCLIKEALFSLNLILEN